MNQKLHLKSDHVKVDNHEASTRFEYADIPVFVPNVVNTIRNGINTQYLNVGGNKLKVQLLKGIHEIEKQDFNGYDSLIVLVPTGHPSEYDILVYESDQTTSEMCGNGAVAALHFLCQPSITLRTKSGYTIGVKKTEQGIEVAFPETPSVVGVVSSADAMIKEISTWSPDEIVECLSSFDKQPDELLYLKSIFQALRDAGAWKRFLDTIKTRGLYLSAGEPHLLLEMDNGCSSITRDACLKIFTQILRIELQRNKIYPEAVNIMAFHGNAGHNSAQLFPSERGVNDPYHQDQTGACGTGNIALATYLYNQANDKGIFDIAIQNRADTTYRVTFRDHQPFLIVPEEYISEEIVANSTMENLAARAMFERYVITVNSSDAHDFQGYRAEIRKNVPKSASDIGDTFGNTIVSSCFHETEHGDFYKPSSLRNTLGIMSHFNIKNIEIPYWDTTRGDLKEFPNIKVPKTLNKAEQKLFKYIEALALNDMSAKEGVRISRKIFDTVIGIPDAGLTPKNIFAQRSQSEFGKWCRELGRKMGLDKILIGKLPESDFQRFYTFLLGDILEKNLYQFFLSFRRSLFLSGTENPPYLGTADINKGFEDALLLEFFPGYLSENEQNKLSQLGILRNYPKQISIPLSSKDRVLQSKFSQGLRATLDDPEIGVRFWSDLFDQVSLHKNGAKITIATLTENKQKLTAYVQKIGEKWSVFIGNKETDLESGLQYLASTNSQDNFQGIITCPLLMLGLIPHIGSERSMRDAVLAVLRSKNIGTPKYQNLIHAMGIIETYDSKKTTSEYQHFPAGMDTQWNIFELVALGKNFSRSYTQSLGKNIMQEPKLNTSDILLFLLHQKGHTPSPSTSLSDEHIADMLIAGFKKGL